VLDVLKFAFFTAVQARHGEWGLFTDIAYADLGDNGRIDAHIDTGTVLGKVPVSLDADLDIKTWIWTVAGTYQLKNDNDGTMDVLFGARMLDMTDRLKWSNISVIGLPIDSSGTSKAHTTNWDAVVGLRGRAYLGGDRKWFVPYHADIGAGQSQLTWQVNAGVGYQFDWGALVGSWRHLSYKFKSGSLIDNQSFSGPLVGTVVKF